MENSKCLHEAARTNLGFVRPEAYIIYEKEWKIINLKWGMKIKIYLKLKKKPQLHILRKWQNAQTSQKSRKKYIIVSTNEMYHRLNFPLAIARTICIHF